MVEKYLFVSTLFRELCFAGSISSLMKNSWKAIRPTRATESRLVNANAEMDSVISV